MSSLRPELTLVAQRTFERRSHLHRPELPERELEVPLRLCRFIGVVCQQRLGTPGEYWWAGAYSTEFFVSPAEDLIAIFLTQLWAPSAYPIPGELRTTIYSAITD